MLGEAFLILCFVPGGCFIKSSKPTSQMSKCACQNGSLIAVSDLTHSAISSTRRYFKQKKSEIETSDLVFLQFHLRGMPQSTRKFGRWIFVFVTSSTQSNHNSPFIRHSDSELITSSRKPS